MADTVIAESAKQLAYAIPSAYQSISVDVQGSAITGYTIEEATVRPIGRDGEHQNSNGRTDQHIFHDEGTEVQLTAAVKVTGGSTSVPWRGAILTVDPGGTPVKYLIMEAEIRFTSQGDGDAIIQRISFTCRRRAELATAIDA